MEPSNGGSTIAAQGHGVKQVGSFQSPSVLTSGESRTFCGERRTRSFHGRIYFAEDTEVDMNWHSIDKWSCTAFSVRLPFTLLHQLMIGVSTIGQQFINAIM